jgi:hypothetical protein
MMNKFEKIAWCLAWLTWGLSGIVYGVQYAEIKALEAQRDDAMSERDQAVEDLLRVQARWQHESVRKSWPEPELEVREEK